MVKLSYSPHDDQDMRREEGEMKEELRREGKDGGREKKREEGTEQRGSEL